MARPHLQYHAVHPTQLPDGNSIAIYHPGGIDWLLDGTQVKERLLDPLGKLGTDAIEVLTRLDEPTEDPFGELRFVPEDIGLDEMFWTLDDSGFYIPVPKKLITPKLARDIAECVTEQLRWFRPA
ncbi:hypothetical protein Aple_010320 [Acrocarpospora pleiomorpha]|uniref:Uncharacterized protein n=1 Tax=Acrocarpospora pleiomorpha TaxID=90975 RepID=A0A5M3X8T9_9ACTN|nr:hypothetical protein [Acrocarpospora pleiomorpha]GES18137.1 hypothetical protein Aple_010320 [Acrocarpospora pleiomorpha]